MKKTTMWLIIATMAATLIAGIAIAAAINQRNETKRLEANQQSLLDGITHYKTADSLSAASVMQLRLTIDELETSNARLTQTCQNLNIKLKRVQAANTTATSTDLEVTMPLRDTIYIHHRDTIPIRVKHFKWSDSWTTIEGMIHNDSTTCHVVNRDTITLITHRVPKKWLFFKCGTKVVRIDAVSSNPHTQIQWIEAVKTE